MVLFQPGIYQDRKRIATFCIINSEARQQEAGGVEGAPLTSLPWGFLSLRNNARLSED